MWRQARMADQALGKRHPFIAARLQFPVDRVGDRLQLDYFGHVLTCMLVR